MTSFLIASVASLERTQERTSPSPLTNLALERSQLASHVSVPRFHMIGFLNSGVCVSPRCSGTGKLLFYVHFQGDESHEVCNTIKKVSSLMGGLAVVFISVISEHYP